VDDTRSTQKPSHAVLQHSVSFAHTQVCTFMSVQPVLAFSVQQLPLHVPQPSAPTSATQASFQPFVQQYELPGESQTHFSIAGSLQPLPACAVQQTPFGPVGAASLPPASAPASGLVVPASTTLAPVPPLLAAVPAEPPEPAVPAPPLPDAEPPVAAPPDEPPLLDDVPAWLAPPVLPASSTAVLEPPSELQATESMSAAACAAKPSVCVFNEGKFIGGVTSSYS
jgi:hypothetical protein